MKIFCLSVINYFIPNMKLVQFNGQLAVIGGVLCFMVVYNQNSSILIQYYDVILQMYSKS